MPKIINELQALKDEIIKLRKEFETASVANLVKKELAELRGDFIFSNINGTVIVRMLEKQFGLDGNKIRDELRDEMMKYKQKQEQEREEFKRKKDLKAIEKSIGKLPSKAELQRARSKK